MDSIKGKMGIILLFACLLIIAAIGWRWFVQMQERDQTMDGTFVRIDVPVGGELA